MSYLRHQRSQRLQASPPLKGVPRSGGDVMFAASAQPTPASKSPFEGGAAERRGMSYLRHQRSQRLQASPPLKGEPRSGGGCSFFSIDQHREQGSPNVLHHLITMHVMSRQETINSPPRHRGQRDIIYESIRLVLTTTFRKVLMCAPGSMA